MARRLSIFHPAGELALGRNPFGKDVANLELFRALARHGGFEQIDILGLLAGGRGQPGRAVAGRRALAAPRDFRQHPEPAGRRPGRRPVARPARPPRPCLAAPPHRGRPRLQPRRAGPHNRPAHRATGDRHGAGGAYPSLGCGGLHLAKRAGGAGRDVRRLGRSPGRTERRDAAAAPPPCRSCPWGSTARRSRASPTGPTRARTSVANWTWRMTRCWRSGSGGCHSTRRPFRSPCSRPCNRPPRRQGSGCTSPWRAGSSGRATPRTMPRPRDAHAPDVAVHILDGNDRDLLGALWAGSDIFLSLVDNIQETFGITRWRPWPPACRSSPATGTATAPRCAMAWTAS